MFSYEFYKVAHILFILLLIGTMAVYYYSENVPKHLKILSGVSSFLVLVAGMGLLARIGIQHGAGFPMWVWGKIAIWFLISVPGLILAKRVPAVKPYGFYIIILLATTAAYLAVNKPH